MGFCEALTLLLEALCGSVVLGVDCAGCREHTQRTVPCGKNPTSTSFCEGRLVPTELPRAARWQAGGAAAMTGPRCPPSRRGLEAVRGGSGRAVPGGRRRREPGGDRGWRRRRRRRRGSSRRTRCRRRGSPTTTGCRRGTAPSAAVSGAGTEPPSRGGDGGGGWGAAGRGIAWGVSCDRCGSAFGRCFQKKGLNIFLCCFLKPVLYRPSGAGVNGSSYCGAQRGWAVAFVSELPGSVWCVFILL